MKRGISFLWFLGIVGLWCMLIPMDVYAEIASDDAFEGVTWEKIIEDDIESSVGIVQSMCATEDYIICMENYSDVTAEPDIIKAYYRNDTDAYGNPVEKYSLAMRVVERSYEHANGMAYNPNTNEIAVALYTHKDPENRGCIFLMDSKTLAYKGKVKISDNYNILGIDYDQENDRYIIQTNVDGGYSFKILDNQFQVIEDLGEYADTAKGDNFQDLCVSGDYIINFPLTMGMGIGDFIHVYSISRRAMVSDPKLDFQFENVSNDEPESICELEPGVFLAAVNVVYQDGSRRICIYKTMVPYNFPAVHTEAGDLESVSAGGGEEETGSALAEDLYGEEDPDQEQINGAETYITVAKKTLGGAVDGMKEWLSGQNLTGREKLSVALILFVVLDIVLMVYMRVVSIRRKRRKKLEQARRERQRIRALYGE